MNNHKIPISIYAETTPNPSVMKFTANKMLVNNSIYEFNNRAEAISSPLALELFSFSFVESIFMSNNFISITKKENNIKWGDIVLEIREFIRDYLSDGGVIIKENMISQKNTDAINNSIELQKEFTADEQKISDILNEYVRPAVEQDGGFISLKKYNNGIVTVSLQGACSGCPSSTQTLKFGIEALLKKMMPDKVKEVIANHD